MKPNARTVLVPLAVALAAAGCTARGEKASLPDGGAAAAARAVRTVKPTARIETGLARATGAIRAREDAVLSAKATGQIKRIRVNVGDRVKAGDVLAEMDSTSARIALENARAVLRLSEARLAEADRSLARGKQLLDGGAMAQSGFEAVETGREMAAAQLDQARAAMRAAEQQVADATIVAPFAGVVTGKFRNAGDTVTLMPVSPIVALTDVDHLEVRLAVPEALEPAIAPGHVVEGTTTPGGRSFQARVRVKSAVVDPVTRTVEVLADVVAAEGLRPGTLVTADFGRFGEGGGLFVPSTALRTDGKASWVFVVASGKAERRDVAVEAVHPGTVLVKQGLAPDADVVLEPGALAPGEAVVSLAN
ncbi:MAG TPA: efflux RND transporter periplasmic adaptor subunit [Anaeromyxobacteraceae bacterium]|nr:efflux RND transporter periplasmic adaptor subunit [Anaeromyxobacteraceae bacterium]